MKMNALLPILTGTALFAVYASPARAAAVSLGTAADFGVLADTTITNTGATVVSGNIGVHPGTAITGFFGTDENDGPGTFTGSAHQGDAIAEQAQVDASAAFGTLNGMAVNTTLASPELGGLTLSPGVYSLGSAAMNGALTLDGSGDYVFQIDSTLTTAELSAVSLINGADAADVFWAVGSSATLGTGSDFAGNIIADTSATLTTGASVDGRVIALNGAVTLDNNTIIPEPSTISLLAFVSLGFIARRRRTSR